VTDLPTALGRKPDFVIGDKEKPYLLRWWVIPRNRFFNIYLHKFCKSDDDRALHDHPWTFNISILLKGNYIEHRLNKKLVLRRRFIPYFRWGKAPHRVQLLPHPDNCRFDPHYNSELPVWTIFITGRIVREWGFYCPKGWKHWKEFVATRPGGNSIGNGCEDDGA